MNETRKVLVWWCVNLLFVFQVNCVEVVRQDQGNQDYWHYITHGMFNEILDNLRWIVESGRLDDYFKAISSLAYMHDYEIRDRNLLQSVENIINQSIYENVLSCQKNTRNMMFYLISYLMRSRCDQTHIAESPQIVSKFINFLPSINTPYKSTMMTYLQSNLPYQVIQQGLGAPEYTMEYFQNFLDHSISCNCLPTDIQNAANYYLNYYHHMKGVNNLCNGLPKFTTTQGVAHHKVMQNFLRSKKFYDMCIQKGINLNSVNNFANLLPHFNGIANEDVQNAVGYYKNHYHHMNICEEYSLKQLHALIPYPTTTTEQSLYQTIQRFLSSSTLIHLLQESHIQVSTDLNQLLFNIFSTGLNSNCVNINDKLAILHYYNTIFHMELPSAVHTSEVGSTMATYGTQSTSASHVQQSNIQQSTIENAISTSSTADTHHQQHIVESTGHQTAASTQVATAASTQVATAASSQVATAATKSESIQVITEYSATLTEQQQHILQTIETALNVIVVTKTETVYHQVLCNYLHTDIAYNLMQTAGIDMTQSQETLLTDFIEIAAHTSDISKEVRVASEHYEQLIPQLKTVVEKRAYVHITEVNTFFYSLPRPETPSVLMLYNAVDRYLHDDIPSVILNDERIQLTHVPMELLQDLVVIAEHVKVSTEVIQKYIVQTTDYTEITTGATLEHLYRLDKAFGLVQMPQERELMEYYFTLSNYFRSNYIYDIIQQNNIDYNLEVAELYKQILQNSMTSTSVTSEIIRVSVFYYNLMYTNTNQLMVVNNVFNLISHTKTTQIQEYYTVVNEYIHSEHANWLMETINLNPHRRPTAILADVLDVISNHGSVTSNIRHAASNLFNYVTTTYITSITTSVTTSVYIHSYVHTMQSLMVKSSVEVSRYAFVLNTISETFKATTDYAVIKEYFESTTLDSFFKETDLSMYTYNEAAFLREALAKTLHYDATATNVRIASAHLMKQRYYDYSLLIPQLPQATFDTEQTYYTSITHFFQSEEPYYYLDLQDTMQETLLDILRVSLTKISSMEKISAEVKQSAMYYLNHQPFFNYATLIDVLPVAQSQNIIKLRNTIISFLQSSMVNRCTIDINTLDYKGQDEQLLRTILTKAEDSEFLDENIRVAAKYYLNVIKKVAISVEKVLRKTLDLGDIFTDAFDFSSFTKSQFDAYQNFLTYVSSHSEELLGNPSFDFWSETKQRGEFTMKFLHALEKYSATPPEILEDVKVLEPLVITDNTGANVV